MKVLSISTDQKIFEEGSSVRTRIIEYGNLFEELHIVVFSKRNFQFPISNFQISENVFIHKTNSKNKISQLFDSLKIAKKLIENSKLKIENCIVSTQDPFETGIIGVLLKLFYGALLQIQLHTDFNNKYFLLSSPLNFIRFFIAHLTLPFADSVRVVSERSKKGIEKLAENISVLPIYTEQTISNEQHKTTTKNSAKVSLLTVARLEKEKDLKTAIKAFAEVAKKNISAEFVIVGDGRERNNLEILVKKLGISEKVKFSGWQDDLTSFYKQADIYISTSLFEGYGMSTVEAAEAGLPLILSDAGVAGEIFINNKSAFICHPGKTSCFIDALDKLLKDENLRSQMGGTAKEAMLQHSISKEEYLSSFKDSIESALAGYKQKSFIGRFIEFTKSIFRGNRVLRFVLAGGTSAGTQIIALYIFTDILRIWYLYSSIISFAIALVVSFLLQKIWAFKDRAMKGSHIQFFKYALIIAMGALFNTVSMYFLVDIIGLWYIIAQIITGAFIAVFNFLSYRKFIFK